MPVASVPSIKSYTFTDITQGTRIFRRGASHAQAWTQPLQLVLGLKVSPLGDTEG